MFNCILKKWYVNVILFLLFWFIFMFYTQSNQQNLITCSTNIAKQEICKTHLETMLFDKIVPKNDMEKIDTLVVLNNWSWTYNFFEKYSAYLGFAIAFLAMMLIFILYALKFVLWFWRFKWLNVLALFLWYSLVFLLGLNFLYWEPRFTEIWVACVQFLGHSLTLISFYFLFSILVLVILKSIINLFLNKWKDEKIS